MSKPTILLLIVSITLVPGCGTTPTVPPNTGVEGQVWIGPMCPVVREGEDCPDQPFRAQLDVTNLDGRTIAQSQSGEDGYFRIPLPPGDYILLPESPNKGAPPLAGPIEFRVVAGEWTKLTVNYDSGIR